MSLSRKDTGVIKYPESDGKPIAENSLQFEWIVTIHGGIQEVVKDDPNIAVFSDLLWYPVEGNNRLATAPDVMVIFGRPKGHRGSYLQWQEGGIAPQIVFEILSHSNRRGEMAAKLEFYQKYGVLEYYIYDPQRFRLQGYLREGDQLVEIEDMNGYVSPLLGIRFVLDPPGTPMQIFGPDGRSFKTFLEVQAERDEAERNVLYHVYRADQAEQAAIQAEQAAFQAEQRVHEEQLQREQAEQRASLAEEQAEQRASLAEEQARLQVEDAQRQIQELLRRLQQAEGGNEKE